MSLDAPPDDEKCCCYCEKINSPARTSSSSRAERRESNQHSPGELALCSFPLNLYVCERGLKLESEREREVASLSLSCSATGMITNSREVPLCNPAALENPSQRESERERERRAAQHRVESSRGKGLSDQSPLHPEGRRAT